MIDDLVSAATKELYSSSSVIALATADPKITQEMPYTSVEGTGTLRLVVSQAGQWTGPVPGKTHHFPVLRVDAWSDPTRNTDGNVSQPDASRKARAALNAVINVLRLVNGGDTWGTDFFVISSSLRTEPMEIPRPIGDDQMKLWRCEFAVVHP